MKNRNLWRYGYILGLAITIIGFISPWWCSGHWTFTCTNGFGFSWYSTFSFGGFGDFEIVGFELTIGTLIIIPLTILVWFEIQKTPHVAKWQLFLILVTWILWIVATFDTLLLVKNRNQCEGFDAWSTNYLEILFPSRTTCVGFLANWKTDTGLGIWIALLGVFLMLFTNTIIAFRRKN